MATQFDATARINVDLRGFAQAASEISRSGGTMTRIFQNLHQQLNQLEATNKKVSNDLFRLLNAFNQISTAAQKYAAAVQALNRADTAKGPERMAQAFEQLRAALANVSGMSAREAERIGRTVNLYNQLASALQRVARSYQIIRSVGQADAKQAQAAERQAQAAQRLAIEQQRVEVAAQRAANAQRRLNSELRGSSELMGRFGQSTFAARSSLGEIEQQGRLLLNLFRDMGVVLAASAISQEKAFAQVSRVVGEAEAESAGLLKAFQDIAATSPISFEEVARIGQLGAQIGIAASELEEFTNTITMFSLTTNVAADRATLLLGRISEMQNVPTDQLENLGSAILALGTASAATEEEILRINESIATVSNIFGLTAQAVTGLASAMATLRIRPELARGSLTRVFGELDKAVQSGGESLEKLSEVMGMTANEVVNLRNANPDEFFLAFVKGLGEASEEAGGFQQVIRDLGINAVRDIDTLSRLGNNFEVLSESFALSNTEWAKGSELQRQSQGIYDTTAARLQNLSDAFKNFAAQAGGPFAAGIGAVARALSTVMDFLTSLGPLVPILGTVTSLVAVGGAAWVAYQIVLSKTIQSMLATRELQRSLGVSTLNLSTAMRVYRGELATTNAASAQSAGAMQQQAVASGRLATTMAASNQAHFANARASQASATAMVQNLVATQRTSVATTSALPGLRAYAAASDQAASAAARQATATSLQGRQTQAQIATMTLAGTQMRNLAAASQQNASAQLGGATATFASTRALQQQVAAATAAATAQRGLATASIQSSAAITAVAANSSRAASSVARTGVAARVASAAFGPWGIAISLVGVALGSIIYDMVDFTSESEKMAQAAFEAAGGQKALTNAIKEDTAAMKEGVEPYRLISAAQEDYSESNREAAESAKEKAQAEINAIEATAGSAAELRKQADAQNEGSSAARAYLSEIEKQEGVIKKTTAALNENALAYGNKASEALLAAAQEALASSEIVKSNDSAARSMRQLEEAGLNIGKVLQQSYEDPEKAVERLGKAIDEVNKTAMAVRPQEEGGPFGLFGDSNEDELRRFDAQQKSAKNAVTTLKALRDIIKEHSDTSNEAAQADKILEDALKGVGETAEIARGGIKLTTDNLEELGTTSDEASQQIDKIASSLEGFGTPLTAFQAAAEQAFGGVKNGSGDAEKAISQFSLKSRGSLDLFLKELDKISKAQQDWSTNLVKISATLGTDIAQGLANLGPEAAPMIAELANLSEKELEKLKPRLAALGRGSMEELAAGMLKQMSSLQNASKRIREEFVEGLGRDLSEASSPQEFNKIAEAYDKLAERVTKKKIVPEIAIDAVQAEVDIIRFMQSLQTAEKLKLEPNILFNQAETAADFNRVFAIIDSLARAKKANIDIDMDDAPARLTLRELQAWVLNQEVQGMLDANGKANMDDSGFRKRVIALAKLVLDKKALKEFDIDGKGDLDDKQFRKLFDALMKYIDSNRKKFDVTGTANLNDNATPKLNGIIQAMNSFRQNNTVTAYANVVQTTYRRQVDQGRRGGGSMMAASGGYISGPGGPTSDSIPAWLSNGEYVINARATQKHRALLDKINSSGRHAASSLPFHYASGGHVTGPLRTQNAMLSRAVEASFARAGDAMVSRLSRMSDRRVQLPRERMGPVITVNNTYPREEPTSITINRALAYSAALNGTL